MERIDLTQFEGHTPFPWTAMHRDGKREWGDTTVLHKIFRLKYDKDGNNPEVIEPSESERLQPMQRREQGRPVFMATIGELIIPHYGRYPTGDIRNRGMAKRDEWEANTRLVKRLPELVKAIEDAYDEIDRLESNMAILMEAINEEE